MEGPRPAPAMAADELCRIEFSPTSHPADTLVQDFKNFKKSAGPSRFLTYRDGSWVDLDLQGELFHILRARFLAGITTFEATINGASHLFDFLRLSQTNMSTGERNSIAWIDVDGRCFFPRPVIADKVEIAVKTAGGDRLKRKRSDEEQSDESPESSTTAGPKWPGTEMLREGDRFYKVVEKLFLSGIRGQAPEAVITSVHRCSASGRVGNSRLQRFQMQLQKTKAARGDANLNFGWYGASAKGIAEVIAGGFMRTNDGMLGLDAHAHGVGVHLSPARLPYTSCVFAEPDSNGERHIVLCRVIMGKSEKIPAGSQQFRPSSDQFDSGMDDLDNPQWYITWDAQKNTHIHPEYVVSFRVKQGPRETMNPAKKARGPFVSARELIMEVGKSLPSARMHELMFLLDQLKVGEINTGDFFKYIRSIVGDKVLTNFANKIRGH